MDKMQAKKLFAPPEKIDGTTQHFINMSDSSFQALAMDITEMCDDKVSDEIIHELNKVRLLLNYRLTQNVLKSKKQVAELETQVKKPVRKNEKPASIVEGFE